MGSHLPALPVDGFVGRVPESGHAVGEQPRHGAVTAA
jgi:hypothetical protein